MNPAKDIEQHLKTLADETTAAQSRTFFKTGPGQYGEGDLFLGIRVPVLRNIAKEHENIPLSDAIELLQSPFHEARMLALLIMVRQTDRNHKAVYNAYLSNTHKINNWDLVDVTAPHIVGAYLIHRNRSPLYKLVESPLLWERRIAIVSTFHFIRHLDFDDTLRIADALLNDTEDLMHKATGWMLREVGKRDLTAEESFLKPHYRQMPRTMLRYAIERFPEPLRQDYLKGRIQPT